MGGGDLNMKKSWHPLLMKNQEEVWKREKSALDERKRLAQLRKEKEEERQIEELQKLQGKPIEKRLDWMYSTPGTGSGGGIGDETEMEAYLLGKKRVDKILREKEAEAEIQKREKATTTHYGSNANSSLDMAAKVRLDPMLEIKKQQQEAYERLMKNPKKLKEMREEKDRKKKEKKEAKRREKEDRKRERGRDRSRDSDYKRGRSYSESRSRSPIRRDSRSKDYSPASRRRDYSRPRDRRRSRSPLPQRSRYDNSPRSVHARENRSRSPRSPPPHRRSRSPPRRRELPHSRPMPAASTSGSAPTSAPLSPNSRLAAMASAASNLDTKRQARIAEINILEAEEAKREEEMKKKDKDGRTGFLKEQERMLWGSSGMKEGEGLADRLKKRGGRGLEKGDESRWND